VRKLSGGITVACRFIADFRDFSKLRTQHQCLIPVNITDAIAQNFDLKVGQIPICILAHFKCVAFLNFDSVGWARGVMAVLNGPGALVSVEPTDYMAPGTNSSSQRLTTSNL
jgi:hypothetical protein